MSAIGFEGMTSVISDAVDMRETPKVEMVYEVAEKLPRLRNGHRAEVGNAPLTQEVRRYTLQSNLLR